ncbi:MAG: hypothetical protein KDD62_01230 [Bdellovibrionales bacterium]|nr:hypothetical protein [Bdellovibrionales bacterium]
MFFHTRIHNACFSNGKGIFLYPVCSLLGAIAMAMAIESMLLNVAFAVEPKESVTTNADSAKEEVLVTAAPIIEGQPLEPSLFKRESRIRAQLSDDLVRQYAEIQEQYSTKNVSPGQIFSIDYVSPQRPPRAARHFVPLGYRAIGVRVVSSQSIKPGSLVDLSIKISRENTKSIAQAVKVFSKERQSDGNFELIVIAEPDVANKIILAQSLGAITATLALP